MFKFFFLSGLLLLNVALIPGQEQENPGKDLPPDPDAEEQAEEVDPGWQCEFSWSPPSFNCFPSEKQENQDQKQDRLLKEQAVIVETIQKKEQEVRQRELILEKRQSELKSLEQRIERKLDEVRSIQREINEIRKTKAAEDSRDLSLLVKLYEGMDAENAAPIVNNLDRQTAANIFLRMKPRKSSALLQSVDPLVAKEITEIIAKIQANRKLSEEL